MSQGDYLDLFEQRRVNELKTALAQLQSEEDAALKELKHRKENENGLFDRQDSLEYSIDEQESRLEQAREAKKRAERDRKAAVAERDELRREKCRVDEELEKFRVRGTFREEEGHVEQLKKRTYTAQKDLEAAEIELEMVKQVPGAGAKLRPYLEMLRRVHRARLRSPSDAEHELDIKDEEEEKEVASSTVQNQSTAPCSRKSENSGNESKSCLAVKDEPDSDSQSVSTRYGVPRSRMEKRKRTESGSDSE